MKNLKLLLLLCCCINHDPSTAHAQPGASLEKAFVNQINTWAKNPVFKKHLGIHDSLPVTKDSLIKWRIVVIGEPITAPVANDIQALLIELDRLHPFRDIQIMINSPGGSVIDGLGIYDAMQYVRCDVATINLGTAASMAAVLLAAGDRGKRSATPDSFVMIHQPGLSQSPGGADDGIGQKMLDKMATSIYTILAEHTGQPIEKIKADCAKGDYWMSARQAMDYGIIDQILELKK